MGFSWKKLHRKDGKLDLVPLSWGAYECCDGHLVSRPGQLERFAEHFGVERISRPMLMWGDEWERFFDGRRVYSDSTKVDEFPHHLLRYPRAFRSADDSMRLLAAYPDDVFGKWDEMAAWCCDRGAVLVDYGKDRSWHEWRHPDSLVVAVGIGTYRAHRELFGSYGALRTSEELFDEDEERGLDNG